MTQQEKIAMLVDQVKHSGGHVDIAPGIHITGIVEDQFSENNIGMNQARFSTHNDDLDVTVRVDDQENVDFFFTAGPGFNTSSPNNFSDKALSNLIGKTVLIDDSDLDTKIFTTVRSIVQTSYDLIAKNSVAGLMKIEFYSLALNDGPGIVIQNFDGEDDLVQIFSEEHDDFISLYKFLCP